MKINIFRIKDTETGKYFAFVKEFPEICAQADTEEAVHQKLQLIFKICIKKGEMNNVIIEEAQFT